MSDDDLRKRGGGRMLQVRHATQGRGVAVSFVETTRKMADEVAHDASVAKKMLAEGDLQDIADALVILAGAVEKLARCVARRFPGTPFLGMMIPEVSVGSAVRYPMLRWYHWVVAMLAVDYRPYRLQCEMCGAIGPYDGRWGLMHLAWGHKHSTRRCRSLAREELTAKAGVFR